MNYTIQFTGFKIVGKITTENHGNHLIKKIMVQDKPELLAPAGDLEKMKIALEFGADAVYFGLPNFSLRARINKFGPDQVREAAKYCRKKKKKFYMTINIYAHNHHIKELPKHLDLIKEVKPDAVIVSDIGVLQVLKKECPKIPIHVSTQANVTNFEAAKFWASQSVERIILARELPLEEIAEIKKEVPGVELECFVHGAMCMAYSGRCILSKWMVNRSANLGDCAQPCRWKYKSIVDDKDRFGMEIEEDKNGTYFFNSYDMCLIEHLDKLVKAGVDCFKIEGRAKSVYYVATVTRAYRRVIDSNFDKEIIKKELEELNKLSCRGYWAGFLLGTEPPHLFNKDAIAADWEFVGIATEEKEVGKERQTFVHNVLAKGDEVEVITLEKTFKAKVKKILDKDKKIEIESAHGGQDKIFIVDFDKEINGRFLLRKKVKIAAG